MHQLQHLNVPSSHGVVVADVLTVLSLGPTAVELKEDIGSLHVAHGAVTVETRHEEGFRGDVFCNDCLGREAQRPRCRIKSK